MPPNTALETKQRIYRKVLVEEFLREFYFLLDVIAGRAQGKGDFTDKIDTVINSVCRT
jgi:hypothetical protein